ncbi:MAG TPA: TIGR01212 family radical SAM protein [bacterium]|nr:TIGR01212 family radical SAM protein [bacterium]
MTTSPILIQKRFQFPPGQNPFITEEQRFFSYNHYIRSRFGQRIHRVTVDAGFTCPNRDGTVASGGCTYCNNDGFSPASQIYRVKKYLKPSTPVHDQITNHIDAMKKRFKTDKFFAYFQAYSNTYAPVDELETLYREALHHPDIIGLVVGTRPDCVDEEKLQLLQSIAETHYVSIEYGCESIYDKTLQWVNRGHDFACFIDAVEMSAGRNLDVAAHIILGFPTETRDEMLAMADAINRLPVDFIKIHNLHIVAQTPLAFQYKKSPFPVFEQHEYGMLVCDFLEKLSPNICIQRLYGDAPRAMQIAPRWSTTGQDMNLWVQAELTRRQSFQGIRATE